ncbi:MAG: class I SAM-dependent methyltransferase [Gammaproteobacteria bacterium]
MSNNTLNLTPVLSNYMRQVSLREPEILCQLRKETASLPGSQMQISPEQGQLMALLVQLIQGKKTLDIGTFTGYSALAVALALPSNGQVITCDKDKKATAIAQRYWKESGVSERISLQLGLAEDTLKTLIEKGETNTFDFAFIDADKQRYPIYYEYALQLLRPGGLITVDNVFQDGRVADDSIDDKITTAIRQFNEKIKKDERVTIAMVPMSDGITLAMKR